MHRFVQVDVSQADDAGEIFRSRQAAEEFVEKDPFALEGLVKSYVIREWNDSMLV